MAAALGLFVLCFFYVKFGRMIDRKLQAGPFSETMDLYAASARIAVGDAGSPRAIAEHLRQSGYSDARENRMGRYNLRAGRIEIFPGPNSYFEQESALIEFSGGTISRIISLRDNTGRQEYGLEPQFLSNLSERGRERRRPVRFADIPPALVHAVVSAEDKRFFQHNGFDLFRILKAAYVDLKEGRKEQGASTLSMQLARSLWLEPDKNWRRKLAELLMAIHLEEKLSKQEIFEYYCNQVYLGRRGTFNINGFGEGARVFFNKDIGQLTVIEAALLAGLVQRPSFYNPFRYPDRVGERRNVVLALMRQNGYISEGEYAAAAQAPVRLTPGDADSGGAQYFLDRVNEELQTRLQESDARSKRVYTTLDPRLQAAAEAAIRVGMQYVDQQLKKRRRRGAIPPGQPQVALIALDPHTGEIKALSGGRNYGNSQLDHALAQRQPGSVFKPFVYAAALDTAVEGGRKILTPATTLLDEPTAFRFDNKIYEPGNFHDAYYGRVTLRRALAHSMNVATVRLGEMVGFDAVANIAQRAGLGENIRPTPALALGAYEATPLQIAGAYTVFANEGVYVQPTMLSMVRSRTGTVLYEQQPKTRRVLDARVAYLMVSLLEEVMRSGTGAGVRARGFKAPAAGKTGTSHDGWFAGFTSELLCVVWVGFDDNRELGLEGARSALPVWTEFMKRALEFREYRDVKPFRAPDGIVRQAVCSESGEAASPYCPSVESEIFIEGSQPVAECHIHRLPDPLADPNISDGSADRLHPITPIPGPLRAHDEPRRLPPQ